MSLPDKITIGCYEYKVVETDKPLLLNNRECNGIVDYSNQTIEISNQYSQQTMEQTFWHEVIHAIIHYRNLNLKESDDENIVDEIATGIYGLMKANGLMPGQKKGGK